MKLTLAVDSVSWVKFLAQRKVENFLRHCSPPKNSQWEISCNLKYFGWQKSNSILKLLSIISASDDLNYITLTICMHHSLLITRKFLHSNGSARSERIFLSVGFFTKCVNKKQCICYTIIYKTIFSA